jgi:hypothetical protein
MREDEKKGAPAETGNTALTVGTKALAVGSKALTVGTKALSMGGEVVIHNIIEQERGRVELKNIPATILTTFGSVSTSWANLNVGGLSSRARGGLLEVGLAIVSGSGVAFFEMRVYGGTGIHGRVYANLTIPVFFIYPYIRFIDTTDQRLQWRITLVGSANWQLEIRTMGGIYLEEDHKHNITPDPHDHTITPDPHDHGITPDPHDHGITPDPHKHGI